MRETEYKVNIPRLCKKLCIALVSDLHAQEPTAVIESLKKRRPDYILMPGDIFEVMDGSKDKKNDKAFGVLCEAAKIAPTFYSIGNHENGGSGSWRPGWNKKSGKRKNFSKKNLDRIKNSGVVMLDDRFVLLDGIAFGGLTSGLSNDDHKPDVEWIDDFCSVDGIKILLCHHPEYYEQYLKNKNIDLIVSGHAHGGQWRFFGHGVFAPGQGIFPKYTKGVYDSKLVVSTGIKKSKKLPRFFNPPEIVYINL